MGPLLMHLSLLGILEYCQLLWIQSWRIFFVLKYFLDLLSCQNEPREFLIILISKTNQSINKMKETIFQDLLNASLQYLYFFAQKLIIIFKAKKMNHINNGYQKISFIDRLRVIYKVVKLKRTIKSSADQSNMKPSTARMIIKKYKEEGTIFEKTVQRRFRLSQRNKYNKSSRQLQQDEQTERMMKELSIEIPTLPVVKQQPEEQYTVNQVRDNPPQAQTLQAHSQVQPQLDFRYQTDPLATTNISYSPYMFNNGGYLPISFYVPGNTANYVMNPTNYWWGM